MRLLAIVALWAFLVPAWASSTKPITLTQVGADRVQGIVGPAAAAGSSELARLINGRSYVPQGGIASGAVMLQDLLRGPSGATGVAMDVTAKQLAPWAKTAKAVARAMPALGTAIAVAELLESVRCREGFNVGPECDLGRDKVQETGQVWRKSSGNPDYTVGAWVSTPAAACGQWVAVFNALPAGNICGNAYSLAVSSASDTTCVMTGTSGYQVSSGSPLYQQSCQRDPVTIPRNLDTEINSSLKCPRITVQGVQVEPIPGRDGKCPTTIFTPKPVEFVEAQIINWGDKEKAPSIVPELDARAVPIEVEPVAYVPPASSPSVRETTTRPDGSTTTRDTKREYTPEPDGYKWREVVTTRDYPPGATVLPPDSTSAPPGTVTTAPPAEKIITCGLPNTPPCKIDESGTPGLVGPMPSPVDALAPLIVAPIPINSSWSWSFALPSNCSVLTVGPFFTQTVSVDLCRYQPMIHDILSIVWVMFTIFAAVGMVGTTLRGA